MDRLTSEKHNCFRETPQNNFHDHTIFPPDNEFFPVFQFESLGNQVPSIGEETHLGGRNSFSFPAFELARIICIIYPWWKI